MATNPFSVMWRIDDTAKEGLVPPITYGVNPYEGVFIDNTPTPLEEGTRYVVKILMGGAATLVLVKLILSTLRD